MNQPVLTIVIPCYNEEDMLAETFKTLSEVMKELTEENFISSSSKLLFVDDGSRDRTWELIERECSTNHYVKGVKLSRNVGHQNALFAGIEVASKQSDCIISIDADLQDDVAVIKSFVEKFIEGFDVVYGVRDSRECDTAFKRTTAFGFYRVMQKLGIHLIPNHGDFRLMSRRAAEELLKFNETNLFIRGLVPLVGFPSTAILYDRKERKAGDSKYPLKKMISFAFNGITSFSVAPIRFVTMLGFLAFFLSLIAGGYALVQLFFHHTNAGWTSIIMSIWLLGGMQLMGIGLIGEYIGKIFNEVKRRPKYGIERDLFTLPNNDHRWVSEDSIWIRDRT